MNEPTISLQELLKLAEPESIVWISEQPPASVKLNWIAQSVEDIQPGDILLIPENEFSPKTEVQTLKRGGVAILTVGSPTLGERTTSFKIPVVAIPKSKQPHLVYRDLLSILINQRAHLIERGMRVYAQLSQLAADGEGLPEIVQAIFNFTGSSVLIQDKRLDVLAEFPSTSLSQIWPDILAELGKKENLPPDFHNRKEAGKSKTIVTQSIPGGLERLITPITVGGVARGYLSLVDMAGTLDTLDNIIVEQSAMVCGIEMARLKSVRETEKRLKGDLLTALLQENITPRDANLWVEGMGLTLSQSHAAIRFSWDGENPPSMRRLETLINTEIQSLDLQAIVEILEFEIICICQQKHALRPDAAISLGNAVLEQAKKEFPDISARCGIGLLVPKISQWRDSFRQAGQALEMACRLGEERTLYFADLSVYRLLLQLENHPELHSFKEEILGKLLKYEGGGDLIHTLEVYFQHNGNLSQAAESLYIHRNTLIYRMERIAEITGADLNNTETLLALQLALRIHRMLDHNSQKL